MELLVQEIQKRPFVRLLLFWIFGILLQVCFPLQRASLLIPVFIMLFLLVAFFIPGRENVYPAYHSRWVWGVLFAGIVVFLAIQMTAFTEIWLQNPSEPGVLLRKAQDVQRSMVAKLDTLNLTDGEKSMLAAITVNYKQTLTTELRHQFSVAGVSHILVVSGFHVGVVAFFMNLILSFFPKRNAFTRTLKYTIIILFIWVFAYIAGLSTATVRAAVMLTIYMFGFLLGRKPDKYNTLACAAFCMLVYNPFYLFNIGFQLSFSAVFFILYLHPRLNRLIEVRNPIIAIPWDVLTVTVSAQIGTIFLVYYYFGFSSLIFIFTNLYLSILATLLMPATLLYMIVPLWMPGMNLLRRVVEMMANSMTWIVERFSAIPGATVSVQFDLFTLIFSYLTLGLFLLYFRLPRFKILFFAFLSLLLILGRLLILFFM